MNMRIYRLQSIKDALKKTAVAAIFFQFVIFLYTRLTRDWCAQGHDLCCEARTTQFDLQLTQFFSRNKSDDVPFIKMEYENYLQNPNTLCITNDVSDDVFLLVIVTSAPGNFELRNAIRYTWSLYSHDSDVTMRLSFIIGSSFNKTLQDRVKKESMAKRDVIQASFVDSYRNLTLKTMSILHWVKHNCMQAKYVMKADDDVFVHIPNLIELLKRFKDKTRILLGVVGVAEKPWRNVTGKWFVDRTEYPFRYFPVFVHGPAYVMSGDLISILLGISRTMTPLWLEDVFITGICAQAADVTFIGNCGFRTGKRADVEWIVGSHVITGHQYSPQDMRVLWNKLHNRGLYTSFVHFCSKIMEL